MRSSGRPAPSSPETASRSSFAFPAPSTATGGALQGWWIFAGTAAVSLLSKYVIRFRGNHVFNPSNFGLVLCFLALGPGRAEPLDFWWGPLSPALVLALAIIVVGGFAILSRLALVGLAVSFWVVFVGVVALVAVTGHAMTARWHLGPVEGLHLWTILAFSPEILVFLFFMLTDPRTVPAGPRQRVLFGVSVALVAALLVAASTTEFWAKVGVLGALTIVCAARPLACAHAVDPTAPARARRAARHRRRRVRGSRSRGRCEHARCRESCGLEARGTGEAGSTCRDPPVERRRLGHRPCSCPADRSRSPTSSSRRAVASVSTCGSRRDPTSSPRSWRASAGRPRHSSSRSG